ncbi:MAG: apolipoprotein N-acyltransferase [Rhodoferax sp.]
MQIGSQAVLIAVLHRCRSRRAAMASGLLFATTWLCATFWWLFISMHTYGDLAWPLAALAVGALAAALAVYYALAAGVYWHLRERSAWARVTAFAALWTAAEMARGTWLTGFGWGAIGYAHADGPLAVAIPWVGVYGVGALAAGVAAALAPACGTRATRLAAVALLAFGWAGTAWNTSSTESVGMVSVTLLQGNIPQDEKFQPGSGVPMALQWYSDLLLQARTDIVVAPETAIPVLPQELPDGYWDTLRQRFSQGAQAAVIGMPLGSFSQGYTNSVMALVPGQTEPQRYDKHHLVPFGEFIPPLFKWFTRMMNIPLGDFNRGALGQPSITWHHQRLAPNICYEDLFGEELATRFSQPDSAPTIFVNVSNIGWFGDSIAIDQHLQISRMRALEFERPMVRATNTGATAVIDHRGRVTHRLARVTRGVLVATVEGRQGLTAYARWSARWGLWPLWIAASAIVLVAARARSTRAP